MFIIRICFLTLKQTAIKLFKIEQVQNLKNKVKTKEKESKKEIEALSKR